MSTALYPPPPAVPVPPVRTEEDRPDGGSSVARTGVWIGVGTITMSFAALTSALVVRQTGSDWQHLQLPALLYVNTLVLVASSVTLEIGRRRSSVVALYLTSALGFLFLAGQVIAWGQLISRHQSLASGPSSAFFYVFTALHAAHVLGGLGGLAYAHRRMRYSAAAIYWHFMAVLWVYLLALLTIRG